MNKYLPVSHEPSEREAGAVHQVHQPQHRQDIAEIQDMRICLRTLAHNFIRTHGHNYGHNDIRT